MLAKRVIVCLDVDQGAVTKGVRFQNNQAIGSPEEMAERYYREGADEIVFYDITASVEGRSTVLDVVARVAQKVFVPFTVGGGIRTTDDMKGALDAGAEKISVNSGAIHRPALVDSGARLLGSQAIVLGLDALRVPVTPRIPSGYEVMVNGGRNNTGLDAIAWAREAESRGAGEICVNSIDADGTRNGYELNLTARIAKAVRIPVIASGGAGSIEDLRDVLTVGHADAALVASLVHLDLAPIPMIKESLARMGIPIRPCIPGDMETSR